MLMNRIKGILAAMAKNDLYLVLVLLLCYFFLLLPDISLPGLNASEAQAPLGTAAILGIGTMGKALPKESYFEGFLPIMINQYASSLEAYLILPFTFIFGLNLFAIRLASVAFSFAALVYIFLLLRDWFGRWTAGVALALIISNPVFVIYHKMAWEANEVCLTCFYWAGLYHLYKYYSKGKRLDLAAAAFFVGLGLNKISFLWYIAGSMAAAVVLRKCLAARKWLKPGDLLCAIPAFCVGNFLMIYYNLKTRFNTVAFMFSNLAHPTSNDVDNHAFFANLGIRFEQMVGIMINGRQIGMGVSGDHSPSPNALIFAVAMLLLLLMILTHRIGPQERNRTTYLAVVFVVAFMCSPFTVSLIHPCHLYGLSVFPPMLVAVALLSLQELLPFKKATVLLAGILIAVMLTSNIAGAARDVRELRQTGGECSHSTAIYGLASWLDGHNVTEPVIVHSIGASIPLLTRGRVGNVIERQWLSHADFMMTLKDVFFRNQVIYFVTACKGCGQQLFKEEVGDSLGWARSRGKDCRVVETFNNLAGQPEFVLHRIVQRK